MGKGKNKQRRNNEEQNHEQSNGDGAEENSTESNDGNKSNAGKNKAVIVLGVYLHCQGCAETVVKSLRGFEGVEEIEPNMKDHKVTVKAKNTDPIQVAKRVRKKTGKHVELISPVQKKQPEKKEEKKPEPPKVVETVLKMNLHCEGCARDVKHCLHKMEGVQTVNPDIGASRVVIKGTIEPKNVVEYISRRMGKHAEIVNAKNKNQNQNQNDGEKKEDQEKKEKEKDGKAGGGSPYSNFPPGLVYAPILFSDENPNACTVM